MMSRDATLWIDRSTRSRLWVRGVDRAKFLHNLTTQDVKGLAEGQGTEAFVTSPQGKTLGYVLLHALGEGILVRSDEGGLAEVTPHFRKYGIFDEVEIEEIEGSTFEWHVMIENGDVDGWLMERELPVGEAHELAAVVAEVSGERIVLIREGPAGVAGVTLIGPSRSADSLAKRWLSGAVRAGAESFDVLRILAGTPVFGRDVTVTNLPQEVDRNDRAICFTKGCYLGQETVARLDALGHVNKVLRGLMFVESGSAEAGAALVGEDGKVVGTVTSSASGEDGAPGVGLGYVRSNHARAGTLLRLENGPGRVAVMELPMTLEE